MSVSVSLKVLHSAVRSALASHGLKFELANTIATVVADAERDGCDSHGIFRVPGYVHALKYGGVDGDAEPIVTDVAPGLVAVDARGGFSPPAFVSAETQLREKARSQGVAVMTIRRARHFSALWWEVEALAADGFITFACVNSAAFVTHGQGDVRPVYGTNPMAFGCPRLPGSLPIVFDQASSAMARGEIQLCLRDGKTLPERVAVGPDGIETRDPERALAGAQLAFGGHKGNNIAFMVEMLAAAATGSPFSLEAAEELAQQGHTPLGGAPTINGEFMVAIDATRFGWNDGPFGDRVEAFISLLGQEKQDGVAALRLPGDRRHANRRRTMDRGGIVDVDEALWVDIWAMGKVQR